MMEGNRWGEKVMGFLVGNHKISLETEGEMNRIQGYMAVCMDGKVLHKVGVLWDTGATMCYIDSGLFSKLSIGITEETTVTTGNGNTLMNKFKADLEIAGKEIKNVEFGVSNGLKFDQGLDLVIGMNIIQQGKMILDCTGGIKRFEFTFNE